MITRPRPQDIAPLDPDEFIGTYEYAAFVAEYEFLEEIPRIGKTFLATDSSLLAFPNIPENRLLLAFLRARGPRLSPHPQELQIELVARHGV